MQHPVLQAVTPVVEPIGMLWRAADDDHPAGDFGCGARSILHQEDLMQSLPQRRRRLAVLPLLLAVAACVSARSPAERVGPAPADEEERWVEVYNSMSEPVTVLFGTLPHFLGRVGPGERVDLRIPPRERGRVFVQTADGQEVVTGSFGQIFNQHRRVHLRYYRVKSTAPDEGGRAELEAEEH
jgi:hypothetical protein